MFKKTLLALAIAGVAFNAAATLGLDAGGSGTGSSNAQLVSAEGGANSAAVSPTDVTFTATGTLTNYASINKIRLTIAGGTLTPATTAGIATSIAGGTGTPNLAATAGAVVTFPSTNVIEIELAAADATDIANIAPNDTFVISGLNIDPTGSFSTATSISYTMEILSNVGGAVIDSGTGIVLDGVAQFDAAITAVNQLDGEVDVGDGRFTFATNGTLIDGTTADDSSDSVIINVTSATVDHLAASAVGNPISYVVNGAFAYLDADADGDADGVTSTTGTPVVAADFSTVTETTGNIAGGNFDGDSLDATFEAFAFSTDGTTQLIQAQSFTADVSFTYAPAAGSAATFTENVNAGSFTLNGASSYISFLPFGSDFTQSITITNTGTVDGSITVDLVGNGLTVSETLTATAVGRSVTQIAAEVNALVVANALGDSVSVNITVNSPDANIRVDALYYSKSTQDRGVVLSGGNQ
jgi:hypothetical protein